MIKHSSVSAAVALALMAGNAAAAELEFGIEAGIGNSDNIQRVPTDEESETMLTTGVDLKWLREEGRFHADVNLDLSYVEYEDETYDGEVIGMADANFRMMFVPGRFEWVLMDSFGQSQQDPFSASTPDNRENINYLSTGPEVTMRLGSVGSLTLFGRYSATTFEDSNFDDERLLGGVAFGRELSSRSELSLNLTTERTEFDDETAGSDYDRHSGFIRYDVDGARTRIGAEVGYTEIHDDGETNNSPLFELDLERDVSERTTLTLLGGIRSSDAATALRAGGDLGSGGPSSPGQISSSDTFETRHATAGWRFNTPRTNLSFDLGWEDDGYDHQEELDRERTFIRASATRHITPRLNLRLLSTLFSSESDANGQEDDELQYGLHLSWNAVGRLFIEASLDRFDRDSSNDLSDYDETRAFLRFAWRNSGGASGAR